MREGAQLFLIDGDQGHGQEDHLALGTQDHLQLQCLQPRDHRIEGLISDQGTQAWRKAEHGHASQVVDVSEAVFFITGARMPFRLGRMGVSSCGGSGTGRTGLAG